MLDRKTFLIKERVGFLRLVDTFDIYDAATGTKIGIAREVIGPILKVLRLVVDKRLLPTLVEVRQDEGGPALLSMRRGAYLLRARVTVRDRLGKELGHFRSKFFSLGGGFHVFDATDNPVAEITGDWKGWNFRFLSKDGIELGKVTKKWGGPRQRAVHVGRQLRHRARRRAGTSAGRHRIAPGGRPRHRYRLQGKMIRGGMLRRSATVRPAPRRDVAIAAYDRRGGPDHLRQGYGGPPRRLN